MKTTIDIPSEELEEAMQHLGARTERKAVVTAVRELYRRRRLASLVERFGTFEGILSQDELRRQRADV